MLPSIVLVPHNIRLINIAEWVNISPPVLLCSFLSVYFSYTHVGKKMETLLSFNSNTKEIPWVLIAFTVRYKGQLIG